MLIPIPYEKLQKLRRHLPYATAHILPNGQIQLVRHPKCKPENILDNRVLLSVGARISSGWERVNKIAEANHATILTPRPDFYGPATWLKYQCTHANCQYEWFATYEQMNNSLRRMESGYGCVDELRKIAASQKYHDRWFCPQCRQVISAEYCRESKKTRFAMMIDADLLNVARGAKKNGIMQNEFIKPNGPLYNEMRSRLAVEGQVGRNLFDQFSRECGWRICRPELKDRTFEDWCLFLDEKNYNRIGDWKRDDPRSLVICSKNYFYPELKNKYFTKPIMLFNGVIYQSVAEVVVAKVLHCCKIEFTAHRNWNFAFPLCQPCCPVGDFA